MQDVILLILIFAWAIALAEILYVPPQSYTTFRLPDYVIRQKPEQAPPIKPHKKKRRK